MFVLKINTFNFLNNFGTKIQIYISLISNDLNVKKHVWREIKLQYIGDMYSNGLLLIKKKSS